MLDQLLAQEEDADLKISRLITRSALVALHRELAEHGSVHKGEVPVAAARVVAELTLIVAHAMVDGSVDAYNARNDAVQKAVEHVIAAVRWDNSAQLLDAKQELAAAQTWMVQARLIGAA